MCRCSCTHEQCHGRQRETLASQATLSGHEANCGYNEAQLRVEHLRQWDSATCAPASSMARQPPHTDAMLLLPLDSVMVDSTRTCTRHLAQFCTV